MYARHIAKQDIYFSNSIVMLTLKISYTMQ